jgi:hypothetical protein
MKIDHLSEQQIQDYVINKKVLTDTDVAHIHTCHLCTQRASEYRILFSSVATITPPRFEFNLTKLVLEKIESTEVFDSLNSGMLHEQREHAPETVRHASKSLSLTMILVATLGIGSMGAVGWFMQDYFGSIVNGLSTLIMYLVVIMILLILGFLVFDEYRKYNKQINSLDL